MYFVLPCDCVRNSDDFEMAIRSNDSGWVPLKEHFIIFNETHIPNDEDVGVIGVKKKYYFHERK